MTENKTILSVKDLRFTYSGQEKPALDGVTLEVRRGDFLALFGRSGSGKSTLLRCLKPSLTPAGNMSGEIIFDGEPITEMPHSDETAKIGFLLQDPENQIVTDKVWHELAFGPESLGMPTDEIRGRVAETASFFGIGGWFHSDTSALSGGQKQLLSLAAVMVMRPEILILDEPTSRLDPIAANELFSALVRVNRELGTTVIMTEHRLDEALSAATRAVVIDDGKIIADGAPADVARKIADGDVGTTGLRALRAALPAYMRIGEGSVRAARELVGGLASENRLFTLPEKKERARGDVVLSADNISFAYGDRQVVRDLTLDIRRGEITALVGGNGSGKTTTLRLLAGLIQPQCGFVTKKARTATLPQEPRALFTKNTLRDELARISGDEDKLAEAIRICGLGGLLDRHPYDLSGGETQRAGIAMLLLTGADILLLDEPTKGTDAGFRDEFGRLLGRLADEGKAILIVSHDLEFCAETADRCAMLFDGGIVSEGAPREFFGNSEYYTTTACRIAHGYSPAVTADELVFACRGESPEEDTDSLPEDTPERTAEVSVGRFNEKPGISLPRKVIAVISAIISIVIVFFAVKQTDLGSVLDGGTTVQLISAASLAVSLTVLAFALGGVDRFAAVPARRHSKKSLVLAGILIALILPTLILGGIFLDDRKYYFISLAVLVEVMAAFFILFEGRRPKSREIAVMAVICALAVAGRAAFFMLPQFKPVAALVIIAGMTLGGGSGFIVGAVTMLVSNMLFSQGPWTPWQMFAMGLVGLIAGGLSGFLRGGKGRLCVFGALVTIVLYGGLMNLSSALIWARQPDIRVILTYFVTGFPMDCVHAAATALFLWFGAEPMCEKLDRLRVRYGLFE